MAIEFQQREVAKRGAIRAFDEEGALGSIVYVRTGDDTVLVQHTGVEVRARGQGVGTQLFEYLVAWARENQQRLTVQCPYLRKKFQEHPESQDVLR